MQLHSETFIRKLIQLYSETYIRKLINAVVFGNFFRKLIFDNHNTVAFRIIMETYILKLIQMYSETNDRN